VPGTYTITSFCEHSDPLPADELCPGATVAMSDADLSGAVAFSDATNYVTGGERDHSFRAVLARLVPWQVRRTKDL
jgi:hypothetical protein